MKNSFHLKLRHGSALYLKDREKRDKSQWEYIKKGVERWKKRKIHTLIGECGL